MSLCKSISTLAMAYLDDELAAEERHELEAHLTECAVCRAHLEQERADHALVRRALVAPPAPELIKARLSRALDEEDRAQARAQRRRWSQVLLPATAMVAAAAALVVFVGQHAPSQRARTAVVDHAAKVSGRALPFEVQGPSTGPWLQQHFASVEVPQIVEPDVEILGARLLPSGIDGHDAALISYRIPVRGRPIVLSVLVVRDLRPDEWQQGRAVRVNNRTLRVVEADDGKTMVSYVDRQQMGYLFIAPELSTNELVWLVGRTDLVGP